MLVYHRFCDIMRFRSCEAINLSGSRELRRLLPKAVQGVLEVAGPVYDFDLSICRRLAFLLLSSIVHARIRPALYGVFHQRGQSSSPGFSVQG